MIPQRYRAFIWAGLLLALNLCSVAVLDEGQPNRIVEILVGGYLIGSLFAQVTLSAAWAALGPGRPIWRIPASIGWIFGLGMVISINLALTGGPQSASVLFVLCFLVQWVALQIPLWALKAGFQVHLQFAQDVAPTFDQRARQFGIRQLLIVTTFVAVLFGIGRVAVESLLAGITIEENGHPIVVLFLAGAAIVMSLPPFLAALVTRQVLPGVVIGILLVSIGTFVEAPLIRPLSLGPRPNVWDLFAMNGFTTALILAVAAVVRRNGYSLTRLRSEAAPPA